MKKNSSGVSKSAWLVAALCVTALRGSLAADAPATPPVPQPGLEYVMKVSADIQAAIEMGKTPLGIRRVIVVPGGTFEGPGIKGTIMPGGEDWQLQRADGVVELDARYWLRTDDGVIIKVRNRAVLIPAAPTQAAGSQRNAPGATYFRSSPEFDAPDGKYDWLNKAIFIGTVVLEAPNRVAIRYYKVT